MTSTVNVAISGWKTLPCRNAIYTGFTPPPRMMLGGHPWSDPLVNYWNILCSIGNASSIRVHSQANYVFFLSRVYLYYQWLKQQLQSPPNNKLEGTKHESSNCMIQKQWGKMPTYNQSLVANTAMGSGPFEDVFHIEWKRGFSVAMLVCWSVHTLMSFCFWLMNSWMKQIMFPFQKTVLTTIHR